MISPIPTSPSPPTANAVVHPLFPDLAALKIQSLFRGFLGREPFLPRSLYPNYIQACKETATRRMKMAKEGCTPVYFPGNLPVVLKRSGEGRVVPRVNNMLMTRQVIKKEGCHHLIVPKVRTYRNFIIEEQLPINTNSHTNITLYENNQRLFDEPVREIVRLFSKLYLTDLLSWVIMGDREYLEDIRYDNLSFYLTTKKIDGEIKQKIEVAFVDLEHMEKRKRPDNDKLKTISTIFPLHHTVITMEADKLGMTYNKSELQKAAIYGISYMRHIKTINRKKRPLQQSNPTAPDSKFPRCGSR